MIKHHVTIMGVNSSVHGAEQTEAGGGLVCHVEGK